MNVSLKRDGNPRTLSSQDSAEAYIRARVPFYCGNLNGTASPYGVGVLPTAWRDVFYAERNRIDYAVYSYSTPIAWHVPGEGWTVPAVSYSNSTGKQQGHVRRAVRWTKATPFTAHRNDILNAVRTRIDAQTVKIEFLRGKNHREWMLGDDRIVRVSTGKYSRVTDADMETASKSLDAYFFDYSAAGRIVGMTLAPVWPPVN